MKPKVRVLIVTNDWRGVVSGGFLRWADQAGPDTTADTKTRASPHAYETPAALASEAAAISRFMEAGGGFFASGDHEDLGAPLCRLIPASAACAGALRRRRLWPLRSRSSRRGARALRRRLGPA